MPLQGTFDVLDFSEVLRLLARQQLTGRLHVRSRSYGANLFLEEGSLVGADQSEHQAAAATGDVRGRLEEICFEMLDAERGSFEFQPGRPTGLPGTNRLRIDTVLARARKRLQEWQDLQEAIPSLELAPRLADDLNANEVTIDQERWRMLTVIDGRRNLRAIGRALGLSDFDVCRLVKGLIDDGVVELDPRAAALASAARETVLPAVAGPDPTAARERVRVTSAPGEAGAVPVDVPGTPDGAEAPAGAGAAAGAEAPAGVAGPDGVAGGAGDEAGGGADEAGAGGAEAGGGAAEAAAGRAGHGGPRGAIAADAAPGRPAAGDPASAGGAPGTPGETPAPAVEAPAGDEPATEAPGGRRRRLVRIRSRAHDGS